MSKSRKLPEDTPVEQCIIAYEKDPGFEVIKGIKEHGRICKRLSACTCVRAEQGDKREACFDWVKV